MNKLVHDETSYAFMLNVKGHCPIVEDILGMPLMLFYYDHGRLAHYETPYPLWENFITYIYIYIYIFVSIVFFLWTT